MALGALGCSSGTFTAPGANLAFGLQVYRCSSSCAVLVGPVDTLHGADTALVRLNIADTSGAGALVQVRATCAVSVTILGGGALHTLPATPTCPDSVVGASLAAPFVRDLVWVLGGSLAPGAYTLRGDVLVEPPRVVQRALQVQ